MVVVMRFFPFTKFATVLDHGKPIFVPLYRTGSRSSIGENCNMVT